LSQYQRVKRGMTRTFQINTLFPGLSVLESVVVAICERKDKATVWHRTVERHLDEKLEAQQLLGLLRLSAEVTR
jgi:branched-chain amino acid transport system ATP-binding protein